MDFKSWKHSDKILSIKQKTENEKVRAVLNWIFSITVTLVFSAVAAVALCQSVTMQESSMEPTLYVGEKFLVNRVIYRVSSPKRGDVIVFKTNAGDDAALHVRRVIGLPGEVIQIKDGNIFINGEIYTEENEFPVMNNGGIAENGISLQTGEYFVLGDNRNNSEDSRYGDIGIIKKKYITGKLWFTISPLTKAGLLKG